MKKLSRIAAVLAFAFCFAGGMWLLCHAKGDDALAVGLGLYFVGKAFFVGPMLWLVSCKCCTQPDAK